MLFDDRFFTALIQLFKKDQSRDPMMSTVQEIAFSFSFSAKRQHQFRRHYKKQLKVKCKWEDELSCEHFARLVGVQELTLCVLLNYHLT